MRRSADLRSVRHTILNEVRERPPPAPSDFHSFGAGSWLVPPARIRGADRIAIGSGTVVLEGSTLSVLDGSDGTRDGMLVIGDNVRLAGFMSVVCERSVVIGDEVTSSACVTVLDTWRSPLGERDEVDPPPQPVVIGRGSYLGMNSTIGPGVHVGEGAYVGEGATVWEDVPPHSVVVGNPARVVRWYTEAGVWEGKAWP